MKIKTYSELIKLQTFEERFEYLKLDGIVGENTFGFDRYLNQQFYKRSTAWKEIRDFVIVRDNGCDLGMDGHDIFGKILVHHMNPINQTDILDATDFLLNPEHLISTSQLTHNAIHYGNSSLLSKEPQVRSKNDTCPWKIKR